MGWSKLETLSFQEAFESLRDFYTSYIQTLASQTVTIKYFKVSPIQLTQKKFHGIQFGVL